MSFLELVSSQLSVDREVEQRQKGLRGKLNDNHSRLRDGVTLYDTQARVKFIDTQARVRFSDTKPRLSDFEGVNRLRMRGSRVSDIWLGEGLGLSELRLSDKSRVQGRSRETAPCPSLSSSSFRRQRGLRRRPGSSLVQEGSEGRPGSYLVQEGSEGRPGSSLVPEEGERG